VRRLEGTRMRLFKASLGRVYDTVDQRNDKRAFLPGMALALCTVALPE
jgi:hypothetical protein